MKRKYPMEAFALAMVVFTNSMQDALLSGILILLTAIIGLVLNQSIGACLPEWSRRICNYILLTAVAYSLFRIVLQGLFHNEPEGTSIFLILITGVLIARFVIQISDDADFNRFLLEGSGAYGALIIIGICREFLGKGSIFGNDVADLGFMTVNFQKAAIGFLMAGIAIAILNRIYGYRSRALEGLWVVIPAILANQPFAIDTVEESISLLISVIVAIALFLSVRMHLIFSRLSREWKSLPIELISASAIYLILAAF